MANVFIREDSCKEIESVVMEEFKGQNSIEPLLNCSHAKDKDVNDQREKSQAETIGIITELEHLSNHLNGAEGSTGAQEKDPCSSKFQNEKCTSAVEESNNVLVPKEENDNTGVSISKDGTCMLSSEKIECRASGSKDGDAQANRGQRNETPNSTTSTENNGQEHSSNQNEKNESLNNSAFVDTDGNTSKFNKLKSTVKSRNYRDKKNMSDMSDDVDEMVVDDSASEEEASENSEAEGNQMVNVCDENDVNMDGAEDPVSDAETARNGDRNEEQQEQEDEDDSNSWSTCEMEDEIYSDIEDVKKVLDKEKPKEQYRVIPEFVNRQMGLNPFFERRFYGSIHVVQHLELMYKLNKHQGCVNALDFNAKGNLLVSGSDDLKINIWDWAIGKDRYSFDSGHRNNIFQAKWMPLEPEYFIATSGRDRQIRLLDIRRGTSRKLGSHCKPCHKLAVHPETPHLILSAGEDGKILSFDIRQEQPTLVTIVRDNIKVVRLFSIHSHPLDSNQFCVGGQSAFVSIYDRRKSLAPVSDVRPNHLINCARKDCAHVTCAVYNYNGSEILASYNNEDIYLFNTSSLHPVIDYVYRYKGHRNCATVKGVNYFGPKSEFIISGSDCGNVFMWEKHTEAIAQWMSADEEGAVNCLVTHPRVPILATSGLDYDVKIWIPSNESPSSMQDLKVNHIHNIRRRTEERDRRRIQYNMQWLRMRQYSEAIREVRQRSRWRFRNEDEDESEEDTSTEDDL
ncbi:DDB1- and CUL4-associated factor 8 [Orussus abietinus]|uniref:DDB1- and CUL4-associated factor 8 n=1 Tax=Orussus abietinus TaxID=222816 RepID=UPI000625677D|nr:DDB1- and CUL4-associated factor 8 [Orussus abietinus]XP_012270509.1 DDB1- and CUL4-associated factor 8 [Orussus abietinus]XP_012270510.1 DDB1- and CUL4-associated factor 8 [Orussus abietinus]